MEFTPVQTNSRKDLDMRTGDTVRVFQKIQEKDKIRLQAFEGMVIARKHGSEPGATFTVRRSTGGYGVEKIFPLYSPVIDKIEITKRSNVRRSKLYFIREKALKQASKRLKMMFVDIKSGDIAPEFKDAPADEIIEDVVDDVVEDTVEEETTADAMGETTDSPAEEVVSETAGEESK